MDTDRELLLYIAAKVARLDAIVSATHSIVSTDLAPADKTGADQRKWTLQHLYNKNLEAECQHLKNQFPEDYKVLREYISLGEKELLDHSDQLQHDILEGRVDIPEVFREPRDQDEKDRDS